VIGLSFEHGLVVASRCLEMPPIAPGACPIEDGRDIARVEALGFVIARHRLAGIARLRQGQAQAVVDRRRVGALGDGGPIDRDRLVEAPLLAQQIAQIVLDVAALRLLRQQMAIGGLGIRRAPLGAMEIAQLVVGLGEIGLQL